MTAEGFQIIERMQLGNDIHNLKQKRRGNVYKMAGATLAVLAPLTGIYVGAELEMKPLMLGSALTFMGIGYACREKYFEFLIDKYHAISDQTKEIREKKGKLEKSL
ncbi:MAG: hypothetical protein WCK90_01805 [archaeon]